MMNIVIAQVTFRQALAKRRWMIVVVLTALPILMASLIRIYGDADDDPFVFAARVLPELIYRVIVPIISLLLANTVLGAEVDDGTVTYLLTKPIPRWHIVANKLLVIASIAIVTAITSTLVAGAITLGGLDATGLVTGLAAGAALGAFMYCAVFLALCLVSRRGMLIGLVYVVVWEGALSGIFSGTRSLSIRQYMLTVADELTTVDATVFQADLLPGAAHVMIPVVTALAITLCLHRLRNFELGKVG